jgi:hypothetical protein
MLTGVVKVQRCLNRNVGFTAVEGLALCWRVKVTQEGLAAAALVDVMLQVRVKEC